MARLRPRRIAISSKWKSGLLVGIASAAFTVGNACWFGPPRYDGAGYAVLARALMTGQCYRAIDQSDRPRHAHFPPGFPVLLASTWRLSTSPVCAFHVLSVACTLGATIASWWWFRRLMANDSALILGLALTVNWLWARTGGAILSEPFFMLLCQLTMLAASSGSRGRRVRTAWNLVLAVLLAACLLTRHISIGLLVAVLLERAFRRRWSEMLTIAVMTGVVISPWAVWLAFVGSDAGTQAGLYLAGNASWPGLISRQLLFYIQRVPDQLTGPVVEFGTGFRASNFIWCIADLWGLVATGCIAVGWLTAVSRPRLRLAALVPILTVSVLLPWPFLEAGRFLIPLVPCLLIAALEGLSTLLIFVAQRRGFHVGRSKVRRIAASLLLAGSLPCSVYMLAAGRTKALETTQRDFDSACDWLVNHADRPGIVLSRHPGEVYWQTDREGLEVSTAELRAERDSGLDSVATTIAAYQVAYLLIDRERYALAPRSPLTRFVDAHPYDVRTVWESRGITIFELISQR
jgi:hypothetical protein